MAIARVLCRRDLELPDAAVTHNFEDILNDPKIDTVVEAIGGLHPAYEYVRSAILAGKNVATANKALIATCFDELIPLAREKGVFFALYCLCRRRHRLAFRTGAGTAH